MDMKSGVERHWCPMESEIEDLRFPYRSEADYHRAERWWAQLWSKVPNSSTWTSPWLPNRAVDGSAPLFHGSAIFSAQCPKLGRAFKIMQDEPDDEIRGLLKWWKQVWDPDYDNLLMLVLVIVPSVESIQAANPCSPRGRREMMSTTPESCGGTTTARVLHEVTRFASHAS